MPTSTPWMSIPPSGLCCPGPVATRRGERRTGGGGPTFSPIWLFEQVVCLTDPGLTRDRDDRGGGLSGGRRAFPQAESGLEKRSDSIVTDPRKLYTRVEIPLPGILTIDTITKS